MVLIELFLFSISLCLTFTLAFPIKHPFSRACVSLAVALLFSALVFIDVRLAVLGVLVGFSMVALSLRPHGMFALIPAAVVMVLMIGTPHADDLLYLQSRYTDNFTYVTDGMYYSENMKRSFLVSRRYGDTYQTYQFQELIINTVLSRVPADCEVRSISVEPTQTRQLFSFFQDYALAVNPVVHLYLYVPDDVELDVTTFPFQTKVVITV